MTHGLSGRAVDVAKNFIAFEADLAVRQRYPLSIMNMIERSRPALPANRQFSNEKTAFTKGGS